MARSRREIRDAAHRIVDPFVKTHDRRMSGCFGVTAITTVGITAYAWTALDKDFWDSLGGAFGIAIGVGMLFFFVICRTDGLAKRTARRFKQAFRDRAEYRVALRALGRYDTSTGTAVADLLEKLGDKIPESDARPADGVVRSVIDNLSAGSGGGIPIEDDPAPRREPRSKPKSPKRPRPLDLELPRFMPLEPEEDDE